MWDCMSQNGSIKNDFWFLIVVYLKWPVDIIKMYIFKCNEIVWTLTLIIWDSPYLKADISVDMRYRVSDANVGDGAI